MFHTKRKKKLLTRTLIMSHFWLTQQWQEPKMITTKLLVRLANDQTIPMNFPWENSRPAQDKLRRLTKKKLGAKGKEGIYIEVASLMGKWAPLHRPRGDFIRGDFIWGGNGEPRGDMLTGEPKLFLNGDLMW